MDVTASIQSGRRIVNHHISHIICGGGYQVYGSISARGIEAGHFAAKSLVKCCLNDRSNGCTYCSIKTCRKNTTQG